RNRQTVLPAALSTVSATPRTIPTPKNSHYRLRGPKETPDQNTAGSTSVPQRSWRWFPAQPLGRRRRYPVGSALHSQSRQRSHPMNTSSSGAPRSGGHVSIRHPSAPNRYFLSRSLAPAIITADDIMEYDLDS